MTEAWQKRRNQFVKFLTSWQTMRVFNLGLVACSVLLAITADNRWFAMVYAFFAGASAAAVFYNGLQMRMRAAYDQSYEAFNSMAELNRALIHGKIKHMMVVEMSDNDEAPPISSKDLN